MNETKETRIAGPDSVAPGTDRTEQENTLIGRYLRALQDGQDAVLPEPENMGDKLFRLCDRLVNKIGRLERRLSHIEERRRCR